MSDLTRRELAFVDEYFICGLRGADAARRLGSKQPRQYAHRMLTNHNVSAEIDKRLAKKKLSANEVLARLSDMATSNIADFADIDDTSDLKRYRYKTHVVKKFKKTTILTKRGDTVITVELELYGADSALVNLGRHYKLFTDSVKVDDWRSELLDLIKQGKVTKEQVLNELRDAPDLAKELFESIGLQAIEAGQAETQSAETPSD